MQFTSKLAHVLPRDMLLFSIHMLPLVRFGGGMPLSADDDQPYISAEPKIL